MRLYCKVIWFSRTNSKLPLKLPFYFYVKIKFMFSNKKIVSLCFIAVFLFRISHRGIIHYENREIEFCFCFSLCNKIITIMYIICKYNDYLYIKGYIAKLQDCSKFGLIIGLTGKRLPRERRPILIVRKKKLFSNQ